MAAVLNLRARIIDKDVVLDQVVPPGVDVASAGRGATRKGD